MKKLFLGLIGVFLYSQLALSDEPPSWAGFSVQSKNGRYEAQIKSDEGDKNLLANDRRYLLTVFEIKGSRRLPIWSADYMYDGYADGILSDDGSTFAYINFWYEQTKPVVTIYREGNKKELLGGDFKMDQTSLRRTDSHQVWLNEEGEKYRFVVSQDLRLKLGIFTIDKKQHIINATTGEFEGYAL